MGELDFSKIFGETATSKASFTDENYINGWGYLGSTPPPYQLFDYLQSLNDKKSKYLYDSLNENKNSLLAHNTDSSAHDARFIAITQQINNMITPIDDALKQDLAPTLSLVKTLLSDFNIKNSNDVIAALNTKTLTSLGVVYNFSNINSWYICLGKLFGNLIIQGGNNLVLGNRSATITLPIAYSKFYIPISSPEHDDTHNFAINMVSMYTGKTGLSKLRLSTDVCGDADVDKEIYCWWLTVGV